jgi:hypothetical protein
MNRKSSSANSILRIAAAVIFFAILAINASGEAGLQRLMVPLIALLVIGSAVVRLVFRLFEGDSMMSGPRAASLVMAVIGVVGFGAAVYFILGTSGGGPPLQELTRWAPLAGAFEALRQWGGLLIVGGLVAVGGAVALVVLLRRSSELPGGSSGWKDDDLSSS